MYYKKIIISIFVSSLLLLILHFVPLIQDDFKILEVNSVHYKIFYLGWPLKYVTSGITKDSFMKIIGSVSFNFLFYNFIICFFLIFLKIKEKENKL